MDLSAGAARRLGSWQGGGDSCTCCSLSSPSLLCGTAEAIIAEKSPFVALTSAFYPP